MDTYNLTIFDCTIVYYHLLIKNLRKFAIPTENLVLQHFAPMLHFYTPENLQKPEVSRRFQGGIEMQH